MDRKVSEEELMSSINSMKSFNSKKKEKLK